MRHRSATGRPRARFHIGEEGDSQEFLGLFSAVLDATAIKSRELSRPFEVPPGAVLVLRVKASPTLDELLASIHSSGTPPRWPGYLTSRWTQLQGGVFWFALERALTIAPTFGITDGGEICRVLAAVAQTLLTGDQATRAHNESLVRKYQPVPQRRPHRELERIEPVAPTSDRQDERGVRLETDTLILLHATHRGPSAAGKSENQDATDAALVGSGVVFALGDGVSTSLGARFAACLAVARTCALLKRRFPEGGDPAEVLSEAVQEARRSLEELLEQFLSNPALAIVGTDLREDSARRILQNTKTGANRHLPSALSTTLIAGVVRPGRGGDGAFEASILRVGDGVVEHIRNGTVVTPVFEMDSTETEITTAIGPGALSRAAIDPSLTTRTVMLQPGDVLLISSDGLVRGHNGTVWATITPFAGSEPFNLLNARTVLERAAQSADDAHARDPQSSLFDDNLSLVLIRPQAH